MIQKCTIIKIILKLNDDYAVSYKYIYTCFLLDKVKK